MYICSTILLLQAKTGLAAPKHKFFVRWHIQPIQQKQMCSTIALPDSIATNSRTAIVSNPGEPGSTSRQPQLHTTWPLTLVHMHQNNCRRKSLCQILATCVLFHRGNMALGCVCLNNGCVPARSSTCIQVGARVSLHHTQQTPPCCHLRNTQRLFALVPRHEMCKTGQTREEICCRLVRTMYGKPNHSTHTSSKTPSDAPVCTVECSCIN